MAAASTEYCGLFNSMILNAMTMSHTAVSHLVSHSQSSYVEVFHGATPP